MGIAGWIVVFLPGPSDTCFESAGCNELNVVGGAYDQQFVQNRR